MIYYINNSKDPYFNLSLEEVLTSSSITDDILLLWQNENTVVVGKNQNTIEEINNEYVKKNKVSVVRRLSGGGAVYQDLGNLNFTFISNKTKDTFRNYHRFTQPIIDVLNKLGVQAKFSGKNDIEIDGKKISGNAQYSLKNRVMHHGTILFNINIEVLPLVLNPDLTKIQSKGVKSVKARVSNILPLLDQKITVNEFKQLIVEDFKNTIGVTVIELSDDLINQANELVNKKYRTWEWNYGSSPFYNLKVKTFFENKGTIDTRLDVEEGLVKTVKIYGDFLGDLGTLALEERMINQPYNLATIKSLVSQIDIASIFGVKFSIDEIVHSLIKH